jgi:hypothetical protein
MSISSIGLSGLSRLSISSIIHITDKETLLLTKRAIIQSIKIII